MTVEGDRKATITSHRALAGSRPVKAVRLNESMSYAEVGSAAHSDVPNPQRLRRHIPGPLSFCLESISAFLNLISIFCPEND